MAHLQTVADLLEFTGVKPQLNKGDGFDNRRWLQWFLEMADKRPLVAAGHWKRPKYLVQDHGDDDEGIEAMRAAFKLAGEDAAWEVFTAMCDARDPSEKPELPEGWAESPARTKHDARQWRASLVGKWLKDR